MGVTVLLILYGAPWFELGTLRIWPKFLAKVALTSLSLVGLLLLRRGLRWIESKSHRQMGPAHLSFSNLVLIAFVLTTGTILGGKTWYRLSAFQFLARYGIMGDNPAAKWVGVNEYFRESTPIGATFLAVVPRDYPWRPEGVYFDGSLKIRTGRSMPGGHEIAVYFDPKKQQLNQKQQQLYEELAQSWLKKDGPEVLKEIEALGLPDYLVFSTEKAAWLPHVLQGRYRQATQIGDFSILRKISLGEFQ